MNLHKESHELLQAVCRLVDGVAVELRDAAGARLTAFGAELGADAALQVELPGGSLCAALPAGSPAAPTVRTVLQAVADRERLEGDMESMSMSALRLLEQVAMMGETLPKLSAGGTEAEIAALGAQACQRAAGVQRVLYLAGDRGKEVCEVLVHEHHGEAGEPLARSQPVVGLLGEILDAEGVILRSVPACGRLGEPGSVEHLATRQVLGVPVTYGSGDKLVTLGALVLIDRASAFDDDDGDAELGNEEGQVAESFAAMLGSVLGARKVAELGKELSMAQTIQQQILPGEPVVMSGFDVASGYYACGAVGGDYFDFVPLADGRCMVVVADVSGHNLASGMVMVGARAMLRTLALVHDAPASLFTQIASHMFEDLSRTERFLTAAALALRPDDSRVDYVSAGHNDLMVYRHASGEVERIASEDVILGFLPAPIYGTRQLELATGDCILLYTDGITEAVDAAGEMFDESRLADVFARLAASGPAQSILDGLMTELGAFRGGQVATDDITAVVVRCTAGEGADR